MILDRKILNLDGFLGIGLGLCFAVNVLNIHRISPNSSFVGANVGSAILTTVLLFFYLKGSLVRFSLSSLTWLALLVIIVTQPFYQSIDYYDSLLFPIITLSLTAFLSFAVVNVECKKTFLHYFCILIFATAILTVFIQYIQLYCYPGPMPSFVLELSADYSPYGNVGQRNQAAFVLVLGLLSLLYFFQISRLLPLIVTLFLVLLLSSGVGMTSSRGGLVLLVASIMFWAAFGVFSLGASRWKVVLSVSLFAFLGVYIGVSLVDVYLESLNLVERIGSGSVYRRISLLNQAWLLFLDNPLTGVGWGNFSLEGLHYAEQLRWFSFSDHAHSILPQIAAELGMLGLVAIFPVLLVLALDVRIKFQPLDALLYGFLLIYLLYSFSEFPLWYNYNLFVFASLVALIDKRNIRISYGRRLRFFSICFFSIIFLGNFYYHKAFWGYAETSSVIEFSDRETAFEAYSNQKNVFGFSSLNETYLFSLLPIDNKDLDARIALGYRVVGRYTVPEKIYRLAIYEGLNKNTKSSLELFKAACLYGERHGCSETTALLDDLNDLQPDIFGSIFARYNSWLNGLPK